MPDRGDHDFAKGFWLVVGPVLAAVAIAVVVAVIVNSGGSSTKGGTASVAGREPTTIRSAPAFTLAQLSADPREAWVTNGGSLANQRYSPLTQIDTGNVSGLRGVWMTHLKGSATAAKYSAE